MRLPYIWIMFWLFCIAKADGFMGGMLKVCVRHLRLRTLNFVWCSILRNLGGTALRSYWWRETKVRLPWKEPQPVFRCLHHWVTILHFIVVQRMISICCLCISFSWAEVVLWSGIKKGPPRKLKFPDPAEVVSALKEALKSE